MPSKGSTPPRLRDVAERAGVSVSLVSSYLNRPHEVAHRSAVRIEEAIRFLNFTPNDAARQLRRGTSRMIAFVAFDVGDPYFISIMRGAQRRASAEGLSVVLGDSGGRRETETEYVRLFGEQRVRGLLLAPVGSPIDYLDEPTLRHTNTIFLDQPAPSPRYGSVVVDDVLGGRLAGEHLLASGRRRIAFVGGPQDIRQVADRVRGLRDAASESTGRVTVIDTETRDASAGRRAGLEVLALPPEERPDAVFCVNDTVAGALMQVLLDHGVRIPQDIAVVGYNDTSLESSFAMPLTSLRQPHEQFGAAAVEMLLEDEVADSSAERRQLVFAPELVVRQSSAG